MKYPKEALVFTYCDWHYGKYPYESNTVEIIDIRPELWLLKARNLNKRKHYWVMRGELIPLTSGAKKFLDACMWDVLE